MIQHLIVLSSSYERGCRIALDFINWDSGDVNAQISRIKKACGDNVSLSLHYIQTNSTTWDSVIETDGYFSNVQIIDTIEDFISIIQKDLKLTGIDVAKYVLSCISCTHLKLQKILYYCYAEYLCQTGKQLFIDRIYAFKYGPVIESVYNACKKTRQELTEDDLCNEQVTAKGIHLLSAKSRILFAEDGECKLSVIDDAIEKLQSYSAEDLVELTHRQNSPWQNTDHYRMYNIISDDVIRQYHANERI